MYKYYIYGLRILSEIRIFSAIEDDFKEQPDLKLFTARENLKSPSTPPFFSLGVTTAWERADDYFVRYGNLERSIPCLIGRQGKHAVIDCAGKDSGDVKVLITKGLLPLVLQLQGVPCLHACALTSKNSVRGTAILGESGRGKSTCKIQLSLVRDSERK